MSKPILEISGISKRFRISHEHAPYLSLRERLVQFIKQTKHSSREDFWALKDVSFAVQPGDSLGIIGKNGAGKSTLLKILSRITPPTSGHVISRGRIASLLEVGTGFHPELTGRENIFLNGSILGMRKKEILLKLDAIVEFSGVERFLDTPLKHYSSGMQLRLAFSVAAFLDPEILIIDEVLAVGDMEFQQKCIGKMDEVSKSGRTILFVSHNLGALKNLCRKSILLQNGMICCQGDTETVIDEYIRSNTAISPQKRTIIPSNCGRFSLKLPYWVNEKGEPVEYYFYGEKQLLRFEFDFEENVPIIYPGMALLARDGSRLFTSHAIDDPDFTLPRNLKGKFIIDTDVNLPELSPGSYQVVFEVMDDREQTYILPNANAEVILHIQETSRQKTFAYGLFWHTGKWHIRNQLH